MGSEMCIRDSRILEQWVHPETGLDTARIEVFNPATGGWVPKKPDTTLFPEDWSATKIVQEAQSAFENRAQGGGDLWVGRSDSGLWISGYYRDGGSQDLGWSTAFPTGAPNS